MESRQYLELFRELIVRIAADYKRPSSPARAWRPRRVFRERFTVTKSAASTDTVAGNSTQLRAIGRSAGFLSSKSRTG